MELSLICIRQIIIMFILVGVGFMCGRTKLIDRQTNAKLSSFVLDIVNPVLIFMSYQQAFDTELLRGLGLSVLLAVCSYALILAVLGVIFAKDKSSDGSVITRFAAVYSNCGFMGIPLIRAIFGAQGVLYLTGYLTIFNIFVWTHGVSLFSKGEKISLKRIFRSPSIIAIIAGLICYVTGFRLDEIPPAIKDMSLPVYNILSFAGGLISSAANYISECNTPLAMICAGVTISLTDIKQNIRNKYVYLAMLLRLVVCPLMFWMIFRFFPLPQTVFLTVLVASGCPTAATGTMFALKFGSNAEMSAVIFAATTLLSALTLPLLVMISV